MYPSVRAAVVPLFRKLEGFLPYMYLDVLGLVTTGMGNKIDPLGDALNLRWRHGANGPLATPEEVAAAWRLVKSRTDLVLKGGTAYEKVTDLRLDEAAIEDLIHGKLDANEQILMKRFPGYPGWPADAQLGLHSMAWAAGAWSRFPRFEAAVNALVPDFTTAAVESHMNDTKNPGLVPRNAMNRQLFLNAAKAVQEGSPLDHLRYDVGQILVTAGGRAVAAASALANAAEAEVAVVSRAATQGIGPLVIGGLLLGGLGIVLVAALSRARDQAMEAA